VDGAHLEVSEDSGRVGEPMVEAIPAGHVGAGVADVIFFERPHGIEVHPGTLGRVGVVGAGVAMVVVRVCGGDGGDEVVGAWVVLWVA